MLNEELVKGKKQTRWYKLHGVNPTDMADYGEIEIEMMWKDNYNNKWRKVDSNKDGVVDAAEFVAAGGTEEEFNRFDKNKNGVLDKDEMALHSAARLQHGTNHEVATAPAVHTNNK